MYAFTNESTCDSPDTASPCVSMRVMLLLLILSSPRRNQSKSSPIAFYFANSDGIGFDTRRPCLLLLHVKHGHTPCRDYLCIHKIKSCEVFMIDGERSNNWICDEDQIFDLLSKNLSKKTCLRYHVVCSTMLLRHVYTHICATMYKQRNIITSNIAFLEKHWADFNVKSMLLTRVFHLAIQI